MQNPTVSGLFCYPIKGCRGLSLSTAHLDQQGILYDRAWMVIDAQTGRFLSQRECNTMARIAPQIGDFLTITFDAHSPLTLPLELPLDAPRRRVTVWNATDDALDAGDEAAGWFAEVLGRDCRLVRTPTDYTRRVNPKHASPEDCVSFADGFPLLLATEASLADLNTHGNFPATMDRFRPNVVIANTEAWIEDKWKRLQIGDVTFRSPKKCARCGVPAIDQTTGERDGIAILTTLAERRKGAFGKVFFGMNLIHDNKNGVLNVGDDVITLG
jgi:uncharacterized protein